MKIKKIIKRIVSITLIGLIGLNAIGFTVNATDTTLFTYSNSTINGYTGTEIDIELPAEIDGVTMTTIMASTFRGNSLITSVIVPEGYTSLGSGAFRECTALKSVS